MRFRCVRFSILACDREGNACEILAAWWRFETDFARSLVAKCSTFVGVLEVRVPWGPVTRERFETDFARVFNAGFLASVGALEDKDRDVDTG